MSVFEDLRNGIAYDIRNEDYQREAHGEMKRCRHLCWRINQTDPDDRDAIIALERELFCGNLPEGTFLTPQNIRVIMTKSIHIKRNAWIGARVNILPGVTIGENAIVGTGSVVTHDVPDNCIAVGVPAKIIGGV